MKKIGTVHLSERVYNPITIKPISSGEKSLLGFFYVNVYEWKHFIQIHFFNYN